ncbi:MAG: 30S ribosomal protein S3 [Alphaproteobacteria bacterium]|nr:30S ribosomal protein S3 [Alphaproteobacteria bacterium]
MGQKVNPIGLRLGINNTWDARWHESKRYAAFLYQDVLIRQHIMKKLRYTAAVSRVVVERAANRVKVTCYAGYPGVLIGRKGEDIDRLRKEIMAITKTEVTVSVLEIRKPALDARLVADSIAQQLVKRVSFRRAMKRAMRITLKAGALGIRVNCAGRLGGAAIARTEWYREGRVPLHKLRADIDYALSEAMTTYGVVGVKVWIYTGDIMEHDAMAHDNRVRAMGSAR